LSISSGQSNLGTGPYGPVRYQRVKLYNFSKHGLMLLADEETIEEMRKLKPWKDFGVERGII
jgi:hypothetical protein